MDKTAQSIRSNLFVRFFGALDSAGIAYAVVGRVEGFPDQIHSDVDFVVGSDDLENVLDILWKWRDGAQLSQVLQHEIEALYFVLTTRSARHFVHFHPDVSGDYRRGLRRWLTVDYLLADRVRNSAGFWVPAPAPAFAYYLVKRVDKLALDIPHLRYLRGIYAGSPESCEAIGRQLLGNTAWNTFLPHLLQEIAIPGDAVRGLQRALIARAPREPVLNMFSLWQRELRRVLRRLVRPTGLVVAVLGPDGAGKSTVIDGVRRELDHVFRRSVYFHLRPRILRKGGAGSIPGTDPHGLPPRGKIASLAKICLFVLDTWVGQLFSVAGLRRRSSLVIFDRYAHDMLADPLRYRLSTPRWLNAAMLLPVPLPDLFVILDAPAAVLLARKAEVSAGDCAAQVDGYQRLLRELPRAVRIDTTQSADASIADTCEAILARMRERLVRPAI